MQQMKKLTNSIPPTWVNCTPQGLDIMDHVALYQDNVLESVQTLISRTRLEGGDPANPQYKCTFRAPLHQLPNAPLFHTPRPQMKKLLMSTETPSWVDVSLSDPSIKAGDFVAFYFEGILESVQQVTSRNFLRFSADGQPLYRTSYVKLEPDPPAPKHYVTAPLPVVQGPVMHDPRIPGEPGAKLFWELSCAQVSQLTRNSHPGEILGEVLRSRPHILGDLFRGCKILETRTWDDDAMKRTRVEVTFRFFTEEELAPRQHHFPIPPPVQESPYASLGETWVDVQTRLNTAKQEARLMEDNGCHCGDYSPLEGRIMESVMRDPKGVTLHFDKALIGNATAALYYADKYGTADAVRVHNSLGDPIRGPVAQEFVPLTFQYHPLGEKMVLAVNSPGVTRPLVIPFELRPGIVVEVKAVPDPGYIAEDFAPAPIPLEHPTILTPNQLAEIEALRARVLSLYEQNVRLLAENRKLYNILREASGLLSEVGSGE